MGERPGSPRPALRPMPSARGRRPAVRGGRRAVGRPWNSGWRGWLAAAIGITAFAFVIGRAGLDIGVPFGSPTGTPVGALPIRFGLSLDPGTGEVGADSDRFRVGDDVAWSVRLSEPIRTSAVLVEVVRLDVTAPVTVQEATPRAVDPGATVIGFTDLASAMMGAWGPGTFEIRVYRETGGRLLATGRFTLAETPESS